MATNVCVFPSPIGELHFSIMQDRKNTTERPVSVPYRGATFLNITTGTEQSPVTGFRPLSGSYISQCCVCYIKRQNTVKVSVPYRGATFLNHAVQFFTCHCLKIVSVPYRGATFLNNPVLCSTVLMLKFPSPIGELHFSMLIKSLMLLVLKFPSPIGELHFSIANLYLTQKLNKFPSPIGELHFSICEWEDEDVDYIGFRPLSGSYISQFDGHIYERR